MVTGHARTSTDTNWTVEYDTIRREKLFKAPPKDQTAYPLLAAAVKPHTQSFNTLFEKNGLLEHALRDIGTKVFLDGDVATNPESDGSRNKLMLRVRQLFLEKSTLPPANKFVVKNREIYPAECRQRHVSYRGRLRARLEYRVNGGEWIETVRELGLVPIMLRVSGAWPGIG